MSYIVDDQGSETPISNFIYYGEPEWSYLHSPMNNFEREQTIICSYEYYDQNSEKLSVSVMHSACAANAYPPCNGSSNNYFNEDSSHCGAHKFETNKEPVSFPESRVACGPQTSGSGEKSPELEKKVKVDEERSYVNNFCSRNIPQNKKRNTEQGEDDVRLTQNYIGNICFIFVATLMDEAKNKESEMYKILTDCIRFHTMKNDKFLKEDLTNQVIKYAIQHISGKVNSVSKTGKSSRQYKVGSRESITQTFYERKSDDEILKAIKKILQTALTYFFNSKLYPEWINKYTKIKCSKKKEFLALNGKKFEQIFLEPSSGRMTFNEAC